MIVGFGMTTVITDAARLTPAFPDRQEIRSAGEKFPDMTARECWRFVTRFVWSILSDRSEFSSERVSGGSQSSDGSAQAGLARSDFQGG